MKKRIFKILLVLFTLFIGVNKASAYELSYKTYKAGDEVEIVLNEGLSEKFYVLEDTGEEIVAIYKDVLGEMFWFNPTTNGLKGSEAEKKLNDLTKEWDYADEITLLDATQIKKDIKVEEDEEYDFSEPKYLHIGKSYWTKTVVDDNGNYYPYVVTNWNTYSNLHTTQNTAPASGGYIRPVIKITKLYVKDAVVKPKTFEEFVEGFEKFVKSEFSDQKINIETKILEGGLNIKVSSVYEGKEEMSEDVTFKYDGKIFSFIDEEEKYEVDYVMILYLEPMINADIYMDENYKSTSEGASGKYFKIVAGDKNLKEFSFDLEHYFGFSNKKVADTSAKDDKVENPKQQIQMLLLLSVDLLYV